MGEPWRCGFCDNSGCLECGTGAPLDDEYFDDDDSWTCTRCDGEGEIMWCPDDICRGSGECIHGDGMMTCPDCGGSGEVAA